MECCNVMMQVIDSRVEEKDSAIFDILTFRCPICGLEAEQEYEREAQ